MGYCVIPFLPGDVVKILLAAFLALRLRKPLAAQGFAGVTPSVSLRSTPPSKREAFSFCPF